MKTLLSVTTKTAASAALLSTLLVAPFAAAQPETDEARLAYSLGVTLGQSIQADIEQLDVDAFSDGIRDVFEDNELAMDPETMSQTLMAFQERSQQAREGEQAALAQANLERGQAFLEENAQRGEVTVTDSGLQHEVIEAGDGESPGPDDTVKVHYEGSLLDGTVFDSSFERGEPVSFGVGQVIEGWQEGLQLMQVGDTRLFYIPAALAYGASGQGPIGPNQTLTFKVELIGIE